MTPKSNLQIQASTGYIFCETFQALILGQAKCFGEKTHNHDQKHMNFFIHTHKILKHKKHSGADLQKKDNRRPLIGVVPTGRPQGSSGARAQTGGRDGGVGSHQGVSEGVGGLHGPDLPLQRQAHRAVRAQCVTHAGRPQAANQRSRGCPGPQKTLEAGHIPDHLSPLTSP